MLFGSTFSLWTCEHVVFESVELNTFVSKKLFLIAGIGCYVLSIFMFIYYIWNAQPGYVSFHPWCRLIRE